MNKKIHYFIISTKELATGETSKNLGFKELYLALDFLQMMAPNQIVARTNMSKIAAYSQGRNFEAKQKSVWHKNVNFDYSCMCKFY